MKELIGTKFLFDKNIIKYHVLIQLFENEEFNIKFATKPISDNLEVHSLYIKPDYEVAFLAKNEKADEFYKTAGYSCVEYKEVTLQEVLDVLGYKAPDKEDVSVIQETTNKGKKSKSIVVLNGIQEFVIKKKNILYISYNIHSQKIYFHFKNNYIESICVTKEKYNEIKTQLMS